MSFCAVFLGIGFLPHVWPWLALQLINLKVSRVDFWEYVALVYTLFYSLYVYCDIYSHLNKHHNAIGSHELMKKVFPLLLAAVFSIVCAIGFLSWFIASDVQKAWVPWIYVVYLFFVLLANVAYFVLDGNIGGIATTFEFTQLSAQGRTFADMPICVGLLILLILACFVAPSDQFPEFKNFIGG